MNPSASGIGSIRPNAALAAGYAAAGLWMAAHHPLSAPVACVLFAMWAAMAARWPRAWQFALPALLPVLGLAPWSGWIGVDEFDLAVLASLAGTCARRARYGAAGATTMPRIDRLLVLAAWLVALLGILVALWRWGGFGFDWFDAYDRPLNAWRVGKAWLWALLLAPLFDTEDAKRPVWPAGLAVGAGLCGLVVLWERLAFTGFADTEIYYRTSGLFWEMHVGGAAIEVWLILALPFAVGLVLSGSGGWRAAGAIAALLAMYALVSTLSRGLYLAAGAALAAAFWLAWLRRAAGKGRRKGLSFVQLVAAVAVVVIGALAARAAARWLDYGWLLFVALGIGLAFGLWRAPSAPMWRNRVATLALAAVAAVLIAELGAQLEGGGLQSRRLASAGDDLARRMAHWDRVTSLLQSPAEWTFGLGAGRYPVEIVGRTRRVEWPGGYHVVAESGNTFARVFGPDRIAPMAGVFGLTQRVGPIHGGTYTIAFDARAGHASPLVVGLCEKQLIYEAECEYDAVRVDAGDWRGFALRIDASHLRGGPWYAPRPVQLSLASGALHSPVDVDNIRLVSPDGRDGVVNGRFDEGGARWFLGGRYYFLPWHPDSLVLDLLVERGWLGVMLVLALLTRALAVWGGRRGRDDPLAPLVIAALSGCLVLGLVSSVMDVARNATMLLILLLVRPRASGTESLPRWANTVS